MTNLKQEISRETFDHLVELAALELSEDESDYLLTELNNLRKDDWDACEDADAIIDQSPVVDDGFIIVPDIPHTTLE